MDRLTEARCQSAINNAVDAVPHRDKDGKLLPPEPLAASTKHVLAATLSVVGNAAVKAGYLKSNPAAGLELPEIEETDVEAMQPDEAMRLVAAVLEEFRDFLIVLLGTGLRQAEMLAIGAVPGNIDYVRKVYRVRRQVITPDSGSPKLTPRLKNKNAYREIPLSDIVIAALQRQEARRQPGDVALWTNTQGGFWRRGSINESLWKPALKAANLPSHWGMHVCRHTYASNLIDAGINPKSIQERLGHATINETFSTYGHLMSWDDEKITAAVDFYLEQIAA